MQGYEPPGHYHRSPGGNEGELEGWSPGPASPCELMWVPGARLAPVHPQSQVHSRASRELGRLKFPTAGPAVVVGAVAMGLCLQGVSLTPANARHPVSQAATCPVNDTLLVFTVPGAWVRHRDATPSSGTRTEAAGDGTVEVLGEPAMTVLQLREQLGNNSSRRPAPLQRPELRGCRAS
ncbi:protein FAM203A [Platysternon megacephalum]|uniref:Protein FAM203A n=1 Tax=Platysternon megacephalum TaxID=55544 RepID=A0A4D9E0C1_9SAUR|nr:protein FAM203A [Platysternon megacephalum]